MALRIRLYPNLSLFRRALVNNLIGAVADMDEYDVKKFHDGALRIAAEMKRRAPRMNWGQQSIEAIERIEHFANENLEEIKGVEKELIVEGKFVFPPFVPIIDYPWLRDPNAGLARDMPAQIEGRAYMISMPEGESEGQGESEHGDLKAIEKGVKNMTLETELATSPASRERQSFPRGSVTPQPRFQSKSPEIPETPRAVTSPPRGLQITTDNARSLADGFQEALENVEEHQYLPLVQFFITIVFGVLRRRYPAFEPMIRSIGQAITNLLDGLQRTFVNPPPFPRPRDLPMRRRSDDSLKHGLVEDDEDRFRRPSQKRRASKERFASSLTGSPVPSSPERSFFPPVEADSVVSPSPRRSRPTTSAQRGRPGAPRTRPMVSTGPLLEKEGGEEKQGGEEKKNGDGDVEMEL